MSKGLEALENIRHYDSRVGLHEDDYEVIEKELKALEIIKRTAMKLVSLEDDTTICIKGRHAFYDNELYKSEELTQEEFDLLKEWLNEN